MTPTYSHCGEDAGPAVLADDAPPGDSASLLLRKKSFRVAILQQAVAEGDDDVVRMMRKALSKEERADHGRTTRVYSEMADHLRLDRKMICEAKRARVREEREEAIRETDSKRLLATQEAATQEAKRKTIAEAATSLASKRDLELAAAASKRHRIWLQREFAAKHAAGMAAVVQAVSHEARSYAVAKMTTLHTQGAFNQWISIEDPWQPDAALVHLFGTVSDINGKFSSLAKRQVRCSPQLAAFIVARTTYKHPVTGPDPEAALKALLSRCFLHSAIIFKDAHSPYQLLSTSHLILDMAFVRAVRLASAWMGPEAMPAAYILSWPPQEGDARL